MPAHRSPDRRPAATRRHLRLAIAVVMGASMICSSAACGSDQKGTDTGGEQQQVNDPQDAGSSTDTFCGVVADVAAAKEINDTAAMASDLQLVVDDLPDDVADDVQAYIDGLEAAQPNDEQSGDSSENDRAEKAYEAYAKDRCGSDAESTATTEPS
ncbi:hypothetical protein BH10ACT1_BH10ACT1_13400 [soil metagenome]